MTTSLSPEPTFDPTHDLLLERVVPIAPSLVWRAWTEPKHLMRWFTPAPWQTTACTIDLRPGGRFFSVMRSPDGEEFPNEGCYLEVIPERRLAWTDALRAGFRPGPPTGVVPFRFTAAVMIEPAGAGTRYRALAMHADADARVKHEAMGFEHGWGAALDQLVAYMSSL